jgi:glycosyltransferase involved in cell wall biosynthesis
VTGDARRHILVYRDRLVPRSEVHFLRRLYIGFKRLSPVWVGRRRDAGLPELGAAPVFLGGPGPRGAVESLLFKQFGILPAAPDLRAWRPAVVHAHFGRGGALALPIARALGIPLVVTFHGGDATKDRNYSPWLPTVFARRLAALQREAALFVCVSDFIREQLILRGFPQEKLRVLHYGVERADDPEPGAALPSRYVLFAGRLVEKKGVTHLIEALQRLEADGQADPQDLQLVIVGDGPAAADLKKQAAPLGNVCFRGWMPNRELRRWMRGALTVCVPSVRAEGGDAEGLPNVVIEAMAEGAVVVGSRHAGIAEAIEHERTGLLVPPEDPEAIAAALRRLIGDPALRRRLGANARAAAAEQFDALTQSCRLEELLLAVADSGSR